MKLLSRQDANSYEIYRKKWPAFLFTIVIFIAFAFMGIVFANLGQKAEAMPFKYFGYFFLIVSLFFATTLPKYLKKLKTDNGALVFKADKSGLKINPALGLSEQAYSWYQIEQINLIEKVFNNNFDEKSKGKNRIYVFFRTESVLSGLIENSKTQRYISPKKRIYTAISFPKNESIHRVAEQIRLFCGPQVKIEVFKEAHFDWIIEQEIFK